ncbi:MAG: hypothetical protein FJX76_05020 [Armatimonadetes bacterium]|nr:hypothetical protein [Armatimonadota bacterium]
MQPATLAPADAARMRRAFAFPERDAAGGGREVETKGDTVVLREDGRETVVAEPNRDGAPSRPTLSDDGTRLATIRTLNERTSVEVTHASTGLLGGVRRLLSSSTIGTGHPIVAADLSDNGDEIAFMTDESHIHVSPTLGAKNARNSWTELPSMEGVPTRGRDLEFLSDGRLAIETSSGTYLISDCKGGFQFVSQREIDPDAYEARCREAMQRMPALNPDEARLLVDRWGTAAARATVSPDGRAVLLQIPVSADRVQNLILERRSGQHATIGMSPAREPQWSVDGREVWIADGPNARLARLFPAWDIDLGQGDLKRRQDEVGGVERREEFVIANGVKVPVRKEGNQ